MHFIQKYSAKSQELCFFVFFLCCELIYADSRVSEIAGEELPHFYILPEVTEERQPANTEKAPGSQQHSCLTANAPQMHKYRNKTRSRYYLTNKDAATKNTGLMV